MRVKTVNVTNPRNVLVQIPSFVIADWGKQTITIRPAIQRRGNSTGKSNAMAGTTEARAN